MLRQSKNEYSPLREALLDRSHAWEPDMLTPFIRGPLQDTHKEKAIPTRWKPEQMFGMLKEAAPPVSVRDHHHNFRGVLLG